MRPRYGVESIVLARAPVAEASAILFLLTPDFGLVRARAQGVRRPGAKLAAATQTLSECDAILLRGKETWRLSGALPVRNRFTELSQEARARAGRIARLLLRLVQGETNDPTLFRSYQSFLNALTNLPNDAGEYAECLAALHLLRALGLDAGTLPEGSDTYTPSALEAIRNDRRTYILRVNRGIAASGL